MNVVELQFLTFLIEYPAAFICCIHSKTFVSQLIFLFLKKC